MRMQLFDNGVKLWLSANETYLWAHYPGKRWPCSELSGNRLFVEYDRRGLVGLAINGRTGNCPGYELLAIVSDHLRGKLPAGHPCRVHLMIREQQP